MVARRQFGNSQKKISQWFWDDDLITTKLLFQEGCGIDDLVIAKSFPHMVVKKQFGTHHVIFLWWFQNDNLMATRSFSWEGHGINNLAIARSFFHDHSKKIIWRLQSHFLMKVSRWQSWYPTPNNSTDQYDFLIAGSSIKLLLKLEVNNQHSQKT